MFGIVQAADYGWCLMFVLPALSQGWRHDDWFGESAALKLDARRFKTGH